MSTDANPYEYPPPAPESHADREARERARCPACVEQRIHTGEEWQNHPWAAGRIPAKKEQHATSSAAEADAV